MLPWEKRPNRRWLAHLRNVKDLRTARKGQMDIWVTLVQVIPQILGQNVPDVWPLLVSLGGQYACNIPLSLAALHLNFLSTFFELNYVSCDLDLPYLSHNTFDFNESVLDAGNPHFFPNLLFIELEEQVRGNPEPNTHHDDSDDSGSQSGSSEYGTDSGILSNIEDTADWTPNPFYALILTPFVPIGSFMASDPDVTDLILLVFL